MTTVATSYWPADTSEPVLETTVGGVLRAAAAAGPDLLAMVGGDPDPGLRRRWTYAGLLAEAEQAARALAARFSPGERVAVWAPNLPEWVILEYAAALAGLVLVTVNPALRAAELRYVLNQSGAAGIFLVPEFRSPMADFLAEVRPDIPSLREVVFFTGWAEFLDSGPAQAALPEVRAGDIAQIQYTSGTTGFPKGAELHHRGLTNNARFWAGRMGLRPGEAYVNPMPLFHAAGCGMGVLGAAQSLAAHVPVLGLRPGPGAGADGGRTGGGLRRGADDDDRHARPSRHRAARPVRAAGRGVRRRPGARRARPPGRGTAGHPVQHRVRHDRVLAAGHPGPAGRPGAGPGRDARHGAATDRDHDRPRRRRCRGAPVPVGQPGELCARGYAVMRGYHDAPGATAAAIDAEGWYHTGDLASLDSRGYLRIEGRIKDMIIRGGENIYPREIEDVLFAHPALADAVVIGVPDQTWGEVVAAFVRAVPGQPAPPADELRAWCRERLAPYKTPRHWVFVDAFPMTPSGKIQKYKLRESFTG